MLHRNNTKRKQQHSDRPQSMLDRFRKVQFPGVERLKALERQGNFPKAYTGPRPGFGEGIKAKGPGALIAEFKRASPSRGIINLEAKPDAIAEAYAASGAAALSVLTEEAYFRGSLAFIDSMKGPGLPLLRKDFLIHPLQIHETASTQASAVLLIVCMLGESELADMLHACGATGLEPVIEIISENELARARAALEATGIRSAIIQVNNRNLRTMEVDPDVSRRLIALRDSEEIWISASGASRREDVVERAALGFDAVLVGTQLMASDDPGAVLAVLAGLERDEHAPAFEQA